MVNLRKIAIYLPGLSCGGVERLMLGQAKEFARKGYLVDLLVSSTRGEFYSKAVEIIQAEKNISLINFDSFIYLVSLPKLLKYLKDNEGVILMSSSATHLNSLIAKKILGSKIILIIRVDTNFSSLLKCCKIGTKVISFFTKILMPSADAIICVSNGAARDFRTIVPKAKNLAHVIYCSVSLPEIVGSAEKKIENSFFDSNNPHPLIVSVGRLSREKNHSILLKAFHEVLKERPARLVLVGDGPKRKNLEEEARNLNLSNYIFFAGYQENPYPFMKKSDIFVLSSGFEGFGMVLVEALSLGISIVSTDCPSGPREILQDGKYGKLVPVENPQLMAKSILEILDSPFISEDLKKRAELFSPDIATDAYLDIFDKLCR